MYKKIINYTLKLLLLVALLFAIYWQMADKAEITNYTYTFLAEWTTTQLFYLLIVTGLMLMNWGLEARKWQHLIQKVENISFVQAFKAILCGITLALFTPNRVGEYGGRVLILENANKLQAVAITLVGSLSQIIVNVGMGLVGISLFGFQSSLSNSTWWLLAVIIGIGIVGVLVWFYFHLSVIQQLATYFPFLKKWIIYIEPLSQYTHQELTHILVLSFMRNLIYGLQYVFILWVFSIEVSLLWGWVLVNSIFLVQTLIPSIAIVELGIRGHIAVSFLETVSPSALHSLAATFSIWSINLLLPAFLGLILLMRINVVKRLEG